MANHISSSLKNLYWTARERMAPRAKYPPDFSASDIETFEAVQPYTLTTMERVFSLIRAVEYVNKQEVPGDIVECGVWKGGSMMAAALTLVRTRRLDRSLYLFDTFEGMSAPTDVDKDFHGVSAADQLDAQDKNALIWARAQLDEVRRNMRSTGYPEDKIRYVKGMVEDTIPGEGPDSISILRLDTDWYESTKHELDHLYPRLSPGGVLILDDYGHWEGARKAVDEYMEAQLRLGLLLCRIDMGGRIAVKIR